ncbi:MAG TPA: serine/threonine-protein kinase [Candidatus Angelobacter sp.]|nr:serine/threonine-protein kinase [Candidatus Angelobacter sp.]
MHQLGRYEIVAELGRGAMGAVFRARDPKIDRTVAIKTIAVPASSKHDAEHYRQRFFREAQAAGRLSHPGIVTIYDVGEDEATHTPFIVMECVEGDSLDRVVAATAAKKLPREIALKLLRQIAEALDYAHRQGIVHRDIKPANIMVTTEGQPKIADFGIAKLAMAETTLPGHVVGTPAYMSPEQLNGKAVDGRSDLFSVGVIAYWLLTGVKPFDGDTLTEICVQVVTKDPAPPSEIAPDLNIDVDYVLSRALAKDPAMRYQSGSEMAADLDDLSAGKKLRSVLQSAKTQIAPQIGAMLSPQGNAAAGIAAARIPQAAGEKNGRGRRKLVVYLVAAVFLLLAGAGLLALNFSRSRPATLQIMGQYPFHSGQIYIWVDGDLRYHDELRSVSSPHARSSHTSDANESLGITLPVMAGRHTVRIQVDAEGQIYDHDTAIPGYFRAYSQKTLMVDFASRNLALRWD